MSHLLSIPLETVLVSVQYCCAVCGKHTIAQKLFWTLQMVLQGDEAQVETHFSPLGDSANLDADRCMVCAKCTIGSETILDAPDGTPR